MSQEVLVTEVRGPGARQLSVQEQHHRDVVIRLQEAVFGRNDFSTVRPLFAPGFVDHNRAVPGGDFAGMRELSIALREQFPEPRIEIRRLVVDGDLVAVHLRGLLSADRRVDDVMEIYRFEDGLVAEHWEVVEAVPDERRPPATS